MCLCGTQEGWDWRMRRHRPPERCLPGKGESLSARAGLDGEFCADVKTGQKPAPETDGKPSPDPAFAERPESQAKTAERGAERCHFYTFDETALSAPSEA